MQGKKFVWCSDASIFICTKQAFFCVVQTFNMYRIVMIIRYGFHKVEYDPIDNKYGKASDKSPCWVRQVIHKIEEHCQHQLVYFQPKNPC